jgi:hypothetical protein
MPHCVLSRGHIALVVLLLQFVLAFQGVAADGNLDFSRVHIVDVFHPMHDGPVNLLVRSNQPNNATTFDIDALRRTLQSARRSSTCAWGIRSSSRMSVWTMT